MWIRFVLPCVNCQEWRYGVLVDCCYHTGQNRFCKTKQYHKLKISKILELQRAKLNYFFLNIQSRKVLFHQPMDVVRVRSINCPTNMMAVAVWGDNLILLAQFYSKENIYVHVHVSDVTQTRVPAWSVPIFATSTSRFQCLFQWCNRSNLNQIFYGQDQDTFLGESESCWKWSEILRKSFKI